jgi:serine/threonine protein phosphatase PrpC
VLTASERGASHAATKLPNQDAVVTEPAGLEGVVAAVADGHGHWRHIRSARGSRLAVSVGCQAGQELADRLENGNAHNAQRDAQPHPAPAASEIGELVRDFLVPTIVQRWRSAVLADVAAAPFTREEEDLRQDGDDPTIAYGSTLMLAVTWRHWLVLAQIGDGDVVGVQPDGGALLAVPNDPQLDGRYTTSLCGPDARSDFRTAIVDVTRTPVDAIMLATDGYGNAQVADNWAIAFSSDLAAMLKERDVHWLSSQLPAWAARCASADGSADDTTVALLLAPSGLAHMAAMPPVPPSGQAPSAGSEETTVPAVIHADTVPSAHALADQGPTEPVTVRLVRVEPLPSQAEPSQAGPSQADPWPAQPQTEPWQASP